MYCGQMDQYLISFLEEMDYLKSDQIVISNKSKSQVLRWGGLES